MMSCLCKQFVVKNRHLLYPCFVHEPDLRNKTKKGGLFVCQGTRADGPQFACLSAPVWAEIISDLTLTYICVLTNFIPAMYKKGQLTLTQELSRITLLRCWSTMV